MDRVNIQDDSPDNRKSKPWTTVPGFPRGLP
jgi:mxaK protein